MLYSLQCWDEGGPVMVETGIEFPDHEEAVIAALELACNHQTVELRHGGVLIAYLAQTKASLGAADGYIH